jgi:hypothetical protein
MRIHLGFLVVGLGVVRAVGREKTDDVVKVGLARWLKSINQTTKNRVPSEIRILQTAVDVSFMINSLLRP